MDLFRPTHLRVRLDQLMANFRRLQSLNPGQSFLCPMIKANAYGHGDVEVAKALVKERCQFLGVACVEEGVRLRDHHVSCQILVFGFHGKEAVRELLAQSLTPVVSNFSQLELIVSEFKEHRAIHLKFNTGMNRLGFSLSDINKINDLLFRNPLIHIEGIGTHFHSGHNITIEGESSYKQLQEFNEISKQFSGPSIYKHAYNSAAMVSLYKKRQNFELGSRPGLLVYGIDPGENLSLKPLISPVMEFKSKIVSTQAVKSGDVVSYGGSWKSSKDSLIGIVPAGYGDGVNRGLSNCGKVLVKGQKLPICGRVCMDYTMIDLTDLNSQAADLMGEEVVFFGHQGGEEINVEEVAKTSGRINYEIMTGISERVPRLYGVV